MLGCNGLLSGSGSVIADLQAKLFRAVQGNDLAEAKRLNDRIEPLTRVFYADPFVDMHNRMKEALVLLGKLPRAVVRPPLVKIERAEIVRIRQSLIEAGFWTRTRATRRKNSRRPGRSTKAGTHTPSSIDDAMGPAFAGTTAHIIANSVFFRSVTSMLPG